MDVNVKKVQLRKYGKGLNFNLQFLPPLNRWGAWRYPDEKVIMSAYKFRICPDNSQIINLDLTFNNGIYKCNDCDPGTGKALI